MAQVMFNPRLRSHRTLVRTASGGLNAITMSGRPNGVLPEIPTSCCDSWLNRAMVCSEESGDSFLSFEITNSKTVAENRPICRCEWRRENSLIVRYALSGHRTHAPKGERFLCVHSDF